MDKSTATSVFESLSSGVRLDVFRLLVKMGQEGMVAGDIRDTLDIPPTNLSFHLKSMAHAGLVSATQEGRFLRYRANLPMMLDLVAYLTDECCGGQPELCGDLDAQSICPECEGQQAPG
ncbi:helix-turn-helix domain-containing protein (plasmid) [Ralstonia pickettii]|uniref:ArsR/SmtB family transcription factor n=1 Tax=Ralstonia TaxID=48736 RepID=UPI002714EFDE|nr:metalloregulator ArsR/SmtB family transcription factor [Ralstonia pickettii]WKZ88730.1 helix-turn-helix domain-containing protein [Ralstonia pickettii]